MLFLAVIACDERPGQDFDEYNLETPTDNDGSVVYVDMAVFPIVGTIASGAPTVNVNGDYRINIQEIEGPDDSTFNPNNFAIDNDSGVISYNNGNADLSAGMYYVSVNVAHLNGAAMYDQALAIEVYDVPVELMVDNAAPTAGIFEVGTVATVSYTDTSGSGAITSVSYALDNAPLGFSINASSGEIMKSYPANSGENIISVIATTNLGAVTVPNICVVTVGDAPTIQYVQQDGTTPLTNVTLSPWTAYATVAPTLDGMTAVSYEAILPAELPMGSVVANTDGTISVAADQNLPVGTYSIGVTATNAGGIEVDFEDLFTITIENRWETTDLFNDTFDDGNHQINVFPGNTDYPSYAGYSIGAGNNMWAKVRVTHATNPAIEGLRLFNPGDSSVQHYLVKEVDITNVRAMRISFGEQLGYNDTFLARYSRNLYIGDNTTDLDGGSFDPSNWTEVMASDDARWWGSPTWSTRIPGPVNDIVLDLSAISGDTLKINWHFGAVGAAQNGQYIIDYVNAQFATAFPAEEM